MVDKIRVSAPTWTAGDDILIALLTNDPSVTRLVLIDADLNKTFELRLSTMLLESFIMAAHDRLETGHGLWCTEDECDDSEEPPG